MPILTKSLIALLTLLASAVPAFAHSGHGGHGSFLAGFVHPLTGADHLLAMVAVGLWAAMLGGRAAWTVPAAFVGTMVAGFALSVAGVPLPFVEPAILASVIVLGLIVAMAVQLPAAAGAALVAMFALFHGHAHGSELGVAAAIPYLLGFALATAVLHGAGIMLGLGLVSRRSLGDQTGLIAARALGAVTALAGIGLSIGML